MKSKLIGVFGFVIVIAWFIGCSISKVGHLYPQVIIVGDEALSAKQVLSTEPLFGYRKASTELFTIFTKKENNVGIPVDVFVESAKFTPWLKDAMIKLGKDPSKATFDDWFMASKSIKGWAKSAAAKPVLPLECINVVSQALCVDPTLIAYLPNTEVFKSDKPSTYVTQVSGKKVQWVEIDPKVFTAFANSYTSLSNAGDLPLSQAQQIFKYANSTMSRYPLLEKATKFEAGHVTFGVPNVYSSKEMNLIIPESISSAVNIYWVEFAISFRDISVTNIEKLIFGVTAPQEILAWELIPLRFDKEMSVTCITNSPEIKFKAGDKAIELGKVFEQTVVYKSLTAIIFAEGLQENEFSWSMVDEAVQPGAKRFIALLKVPKGKKSSTIQLQASAKTKPSYFGICQGDIISTDPKLVEITFK